MTPPLPDAVALGSTRWRDRVNATVLGAGTGAVVIPLIAFQIGGIPAVYFRPLPFPAELAIRLGIGAVLVAVVLTIWVLLHPVPQVDTAAGMLRVGRRSIPFAEVDSALIVLAVTRRHRVIGLRFGTKGSIQHTVLLRRDERLLLDVRQTGALVELIERSGIRIPQDPYDPTGRFSRWNYPGHLDREGAAAFVRSPPEPGDELPLPS